MFNKGFTHLVFLVVRVGLAASVQRSGQLGQELLQFGSVGERRVLQVELASHRSDAEVGLYGNLVRGKQRLQQRDEFVRNSILNISGPSVQP